MSELTVTHRTTVTEDQIDHLGHMNVRFYGVAARAGSDAVTADLGAGDRRLDAVDLYTRHLREQMLGADLEVRSGVLGGAHGEVRLYHELRNVDTDDLAASFVHRLVVAAAGESGGDPAPWPDPALVAERATEIPERGRPRTIDLALDPTDNPPSLDQARDLGLAIRATRAIGADECRADGSYQLSFAPMLVWGGEPLHTTTGATLIDGPNGEKVGLASMETRTLIQRMPRLGDQVQSFSATLAINDKTTHRILWAFDTEVGDLLLAFEVVDLAFDTVARRPMVLPDALRRQAEAVLHPEFAPA